MKKTKIILIAALGICMLSFMPAVLGKADSRPIEAFTETNFCVAAWSDGESGLTIVPHGIFWPGPTEMIIECIHHGSVLVKDLKDGRIMYKVNLHVKGALMEIYLNEDLGEQDPLPIFVGEMDYQFTATVIVYDGELDDAVPNLLLIWFPGWFGIEPIGECTFSHLTGGGTGEFTEYGESSGFGLEGDSAKAKVIQVGILKPEGMVWPVELVFLH